jgi:putative hydrolase of the HAD superfamily
VAIRAVLFDYAGVMTEDIRPVIADLAAASGADPGELGRLLAGDYGMDASSHPWHRVERGEMTIDDLVTWGRREGQARGWALDLRTLMVGLMAVPIRQTIVEKARRLRGQGYRTALITNNAKELAPLWRAKFPVDEVVDSSAVGFRKPEAEIFELTLERLDVSAGEAVLLDDMEVNIAAARAATPSARATPVAGPATAATPTPSLTAADVGALPATDPR